MRPTPGGETIASRPRKFSSSSAEAHSGTNVSSANAPTTFFLASQSNVDKATATDVAIAPAPATTTGDSRRLENAEASQSSEGEQIKVDALQSEDEGHSSGQATHHDQGGESTFKRLLGLRKRSMPSPLSSPQTSNLPMATDGSLRRSPERDETEEGRPLGAHHRDISRTTISQPLSPFMTQAPSPLGSAPPGSPRSGSLRLSDEELSAEDGASQVIASSDEDDEVSNMVQQTAGGLATAASSTPQLVMPNPAMPSRRPFTTLGRRMGRLKVCVVGPTGSGKTALIKAIIQQCEHIVHVDPSITVNTEITQAATSQSLAKSSLRAASITSEITEIYASTKSYPPWWTDVEESRVLRRRKSMEDVILERNICFVDTPGLDVPEAQRSITKYIEAQIHRNFDVSKLKEDELLNFLTGGGGVHVDLVFFLFDPHSDMTRDVKSMEQLSTLTNIIPLIAKADTMSAETLRQLKIDLVDALQKSSARPFRFGQSPPDLLDHHKSRTQPTDVADSQSTTHGPSDTIQSLSTAENDKIARNKVLPPFAVSAMSDNNDAEMDASLLMSPAYTPPLISSDLAALVSMVFDPEQIPSLRHSATRKLLRWRKQAQRRSSNMSQEHSDAPHGTLRRGTGVFKVDSLKSDDLLLQESLATWNPILRELYPTAALGVGMPEYIRDRLRAQALLEERNARKQVTRWVAGLQRALSKERRQFAAVARADRASWLLNQIGEEAEEGSIGVDDAATAARRLTPSILSQPDNRALSARLKDDLPRSLSSSHRKTSHGKVLPSWARSTRNAESSGRGAGRDRTFGNNIRQTTFNILKVVGGSFIVTAAYFVVMNALQKSTTPPSKLTSSWYSPSWLVDFMGRMVWPYEAQEELWT